ncbi:MULTISPECIES: MBL fold metallo-hydrolase [unclassified Thioalkalivibrio]|uniref:MBL fold metallo-hydrolase n=1 Tax=unclassified Thioalkalivibrio TaxID=2621013 RepID=UPI0004780480|nr:MULTISPECIES: MBL fold metallo-hydrolase [unclassified Thioalkalivibrio]
MGNGTWAYLQPDGGWGWSNAGLIRDGEEALLVDTLFDERLTAEMLAQMDAATGIGAGDINLLVNTHANGDHTFGNRLVHQAEIIASQASADEMPELPPAMLAGLMAQSGAMGEVGKYLQRSFGAFDFGGVELTLPTRTFSGELGLKVGDKDVKLIEVGPAHTRGDVLVHVPSDRVVYTGDILFIEGTPVMWAGPVGNWIAAIDRILGMDVETIVPGHGPITDHAGARQVRDYLVYIDREARARFDAGMPAAEASFDIALGDYANWGDAERIAVNVDTLYREYAGDTTTPDIMQLLRLMARLDAARRGSR